MKKITMTLVFALMMSVSAAIAADIAIVQAKQHFAQPTITIKAGDKLIFKNEDDVKHNIIVIDSEGDSVDKGIQPPGTNIEHVFAKPGVYRVRCNIHPTMKLDVTVQ